MKVCFISGAYPPIRCGIGDFVQRLAATLAEQGTAVRVLTSREGVLLEREGAVQVLPVVQHWDMRALPAILKQVRVLAPDIVNVHYPTQRYGRQPLVNLLPMFIRARLHVPAVTTIHEFSTYHRLGKARVGLSVLTSDHIIVADQINLGQMMRAFPGARSKLQHVPLGANIEPHLSKESDRRHVRASFGAVDTDVVIAYFGFISPSKGIETLLNAFRQASAESPNLHLLLIASREPADPNYAAYHRKVAQMLNEWRVDNRIHWMGYVVPAQVSAYLSAADFAVLPFNDGASLRRTTLLSALAHGLPVISTRGLITPGGLGDEQGVRLVAARDERALAAEITALTNDGARRRWLSTRACEFARNFAWVNVAAQTLNVYRLVLGT